MDETYKVIYSPVFWITSGILGIIFGVIANYCKDGLDKLFSIFSSKWRNRTVTKKEAWNKKVQALVGNKEAQEQEMRDEFRKKLDAIYSLIFCVLLYGVGTITRYEYPFSFMWFFVILLHIGSFILFFSAMSDYGKASNIYKSILEARLIEAKAEAKQLETNIKQIRDETLKLNIETEL